MDEQLVRVGLDDLTRRARTRTQDLEQASSDGGGHPGIEQCLQVVRAALPKLEDLLARRRLTVELEIPRELLPALRSGELRRVGGVIRDRETGEIVKHLQDARPDKLAKAVKLGFLALDVLESYLLNEKLDEVVSYVQGIDGKLDAQNQGRLRGALQEFADLAYLENEDTRQAKILHVQSALSHCQGLFEELLAREEERFGALKKEFAAARLKNSDELRKLGQTTETIANHLRAVVFLRGARVELYRQQGESLLAEKTAYELVDFLSEHLDWLHSELTGDAMTRLALDFKKIWRRNELFQEYQDRVNGPLREAEYLLLRMLDRALLLGAQEPGPVLDPGPEPAEGEAGDGG